MEFFLEGLLISFLFTLGLSFLVGLGLLLAPGQMARLSAYCNHRYSLRRALRPLDIPRNHARFFYRYHKGVGLSLVIGGSYTLYYLPFSFDINAAAAIFPLDVAPVISDWLLDSAHLFLLSGNVFALLIGGVVYLRPSLLKGFEARANAWVSTRRLTRPLDKSRTQVDDFCFHHTRLTGAVLILGSLYIFLILVVYGHRLL